MVIELDESPSPGVGHQILVTEISQKNDRPCEFGTKSCGRYKAFIDLPGIYNFTGNFSIEDIT